MGFIVGMKEECFIIGNVIKHKQQQHADETNIRHNIL